MVNAPIAQGLGVGTQSCGIQTDVPISEIFSILKEFRPNMKKLRGYTSTPISEFLLREGDYLAPQFGLVMEVVNVPSKLKFTEEFLKAKEDFDAIYIVPDPIYTLENLENISNFAKSRSKILATQVPYLINLGATFSLTPFFARTGTLLADLSNKVLNEQIKCKDGLRYALKEFHFQINREYAESSNVYIPLNLEERVKNSSLLLEGIQYFELENYELSYLIMKKILRVDETNPTALYYQAQINKVLHGNQIRELLEKADSAKEKGNLAQEREYLNKILKLEPQNEKIQKRILESKELESERETEQAERLEKLTDPFLAIQHYTNAIQINPDNQKARQRLSSLRARLSSSISNLFARAKLQYEQRDYEEAISLFKKILLIEPNHKTSLEYLRLAGDKKIAMGRIKECLKNKNQNCYLLWSK